MNAPITDITHQTLMWAILTADTVNGTDRLGMKFIEETRSERRQKEKQLSLEGAP